jgi:exonuclease III
MAGKHSKRRCSALVFHAEKSRPADARFMRKAFREKKELMKLKIMTWNMNYFQRKEPQRIAAWNLIKDADIDIAILQEAKPCLRFLDGYNIYFQSLPVRGNWGSAIVTRKWDAFKRVFLSTYEGSAGLMCYDFKTEEDTVVTIVNLYGKMNSCGYCTTTIHHMLSDITPVVWGRPKNLIVMAGDLNTSTQWDEKYNYKDPAHKLVFDRIDNMKFTNCTMAQFGEHRQTFVRENTYPYQDDYIFIKGHKDGAWEVKIRDDEDILNYSDHFPVELTIEI